MAPLTDVDAGSGGVAGARSERLRLSASRRSSSTTSDSRSTITMR